MNVQQVEKQFVCVVVSASIFLSICIAKPVAAGNAKFLLPSQQLLGSGSIIDVLVVGLTADLEIDDLVQEGDLTSFIILLLRAWDKEQEST